VVETTISLDDLYGADECFLTGSAAEVVPVIKVDGNVIGDGTPGPITARLTSLFRQAVQQDAS